jgi:hypothetical protein
MRALHLAPLAASLLLGCGGGDAGSDASSSSILTTIDGAGGAGGAAGTGGAPGSTTSAAGAGTTSSHAGGATTTSHAGGGSTTTSAGGAGGGTTTSAGGAGGAPGPDFASIPWETGAGVGYGVARKDALNPLGDEVFIGYAGYAVNLDESCAWVTALYEAALRKRGVRWVYCVQGPEDPTYSKLEIGNSKIVAHLTQTVGPSTHFILAAAHSSGAFVAHELLGQLANGLDPQGVTDGKVVYFDLDGGTGGLTQPIVARLKKAYFVAARDVATGTDSPNHSFMVAGGQTYAAAGGFLELDASASGCDPGAKWCVHMTLVTKQPHDPSKASAALDYTDFAGRPVVADYVDAKSAEAGLGP